MGPRRTAGIRAHLKPFSLKEATSLGVILYYCHRSAARFYSKVWRKNAYLSQIARLFLYSLRLASPMR